MSLHAITYLLEEELSKLKDLMLHALHSEVEAVRDMGKYMIGNKGKRIRPLVLLLSAKACGADGADMIHAAAIIEFIHTATLLHDDVVDGSDLRRGKPAAHKLWDNSHAVLVGDFLYSRAFQMIAKLAHPACIQILADATNIIAEGEVLQLSHRFVTELEEADYFKVIRLKTATLFHAAAQIGGLLGAENAITTAALSRYGMHLGTAFQLVDDILDYRLDNPLWGKNVGDDLAEGKTTLPLIYALQKTTPTKKTWLQEALVEGNLDSLTQIHEIMTETGAMDYSLERAREEIALAHEALTILPPSPYREGMHNLATFALSREN